MGERKWTGTTYGNGWMHRWLIRALKYVDVRFIYAFSSIFVVPVCLLLNPSRKIIYQYFKERIGYSTIKSAWMTYVNHCIFSETVIDKFAMYAGKEFMVEVDGYDILQSLAIKEKGFVQLSSHIGNYEIAGYTLVAKDKPFNALVFGGEKQSVMDNRDKMFTETNIKMIFAKGDMEHLFEIDKALSDGEIVSMPADRFWGSQKYIETDFLNKPARFPLGPFSVATIKEVDAIAVNVMKESTLKYKIYVSKLSYDKSKPRKEQMRDLCQSYVSELEKMVKQYPCQWFNFYDFWNYERN